MRLSSQNHIIQGALVLLSICLMIGLSILDTVAADWPIRLVLDEVDETTVHFSVDSERDYPEALAIVSSYLKSGQMVETKVDPMDIAAGRQTKTVRLNKPFDYVHVFLLDASTKNPISMKGKMFEVRFLDYDGRVISTILSGGNVRVPCPPTREGFLFSGWDKPLKSITEDTEVNAQYLTGDEANIFAVSTENGGVGDSISVTVKLQGTSLLSGFDMRLRYNADLLEFVSLDSQRAFDVTANKVAGSNLIAFNYSSARNVNKTGEILSATFRIKDSNADFARVWLEPKQVCYQDGNSIIDAAFHMAEGGVLIQ